MATVQEKTHGLSKILHKIKALDKFGCWAVVRRAVSLVENEMKVSHSIEKSEALCRPGDHDCGPDRCLNFSMEEAISEIQSEDRRRSTLLDPEEALVANLIDFYEGRLDVLEVRNSNKYLIEDNESTVLEKVREHVPVVTVNYGLFDKEIVLASLKGLIKDIETESNETEEVCYEPEADESTELLEVCRRIATRVGATRWTNGGKTLQQRTDTVYECKRRDACCWNNTWNKVRHGAWKTIWNDGNSSNTPPVTPGPFPPVRWDNSIPFASPESQGTLTSDWGWRNIGGAPDFHGGIDVAFPQGTPIYLAQDATVVKVQDGGIFGHDAGVVVAVGNTTYTYWHIDPANTLIPGMPLNKGTLLGNVAGGGPAHLHYAIHNTPSGDPNERNDGNSVNPQ